METLRRHFPQLAAAGLCAILVLAVAWQLGRLTPAPPPAPLHLAKPWQHPHAFTVPPGWVKLKAGDAFTFYAPPDAVLPSAKAEPGKHDVDLPGHDAFVGHLDLPGIALRFDYGAFDDDLSFAAQGKDELEEALMIDGRDANIVTARDLPRPVSFAPADPYFIGLLVPRVTPRTAYYGLSDVVWNRLRFFGYAKTQADAQTVRQILLTVEFTAPPPE